ncbi:MAG: UDP-N-acetylglucosamine 1-carboxyvinyltransferase [Acidobacteria bacterium]|nr:UDP-N-acetylglucosamine 1-carboxyvinyltransferase [Acidobacteriota bacterium]MCI0622934.1 UDP-N-acetylglucosamine 1-carboxyvinyltransferase [Acidobacteriota bacterium]MCI0719993.1 UDP-N-acetylglucosamine 1-carboxyvinyltransferase [Acidobacteriota bacterium]
MDKILIKGGKPLLGSVEISGAKNAALPALAATLLTGDAVVLQNVPCVRDIQTTGQVLRDLGCDTDFRTLALTHSCRVSAQNVTSCEAPYELVKTMRASVLVLGPLLARFGKARVSLPGGCAIGARPIDLHIKAFEKLGAEIAIEHGYVEARAPRLKGAEIFFDRITVTGTENLMMAAALAEGHTVLNNAAREPEVADLADLLRAMGAQISGEGSSVIRIQGVERLHGAQHTIIPDRIETGTFLAAGAITGGEVEIRACRPDHLCAVIEKLEETGVVIERPSPSILKVSAPHGIKARNVTTVEHPGFATDMQAQYMALMTQGEGTSIVTETIFENRFMHASEMVRMGASIKIEGNRAIVFGKTQLTGAKVIASDLRASASLVLAGLVAQGDTLIDRVYHLDRGYEGIEEKLKALGADIHRSQ